MLELKYFPFTGEEYKPQLGLKPLDLAEWIEIGADYEAQLSEKKRLLKERREAVLMVLPVAREGCLELRDVIAQHLSERFPERFSLDASSLSTRGEVFEKPESGGEALAQIAQWTQEDWALLSAEPPVRLEAACICFPSRWSLAEKIGREPSDVHGPVPRFATIAKPTQGFLERTSADKPMWRINWTIHDSDVLFCPGPHPGREDLRAENIIDSTFLRLERQTLRRLPRTGMVAFSIRTYVHPLKAVVENTERRQVLKASLQGLDADTADYKGMKHIHELLREAL